MRMLIVVISLVLLVPMVAGAEEADSLAAVAGRAAQEPAGSQDRVRSTGRTWAGLAMLGGGAVLTVHAATAACATTAVASAVFDTQTCGQAWTKFGARTWTRDGRDPARDRLV